MLKYLVLSLFFLSLTPALPLEEEQVDQVEQVDSETEETNSLEETEFGVGIYNETESDKPHPRIAQVSLNNKIYTFFFQPINWHAAVELCNSQNLVIASVSNMDENSELIDSLAKYGLLYSGSSFWLGASDLSHPGQFSWLKNGRPVLFTNWAAGEPNNAGGSEHCLELQSSGRWNDLNCDRPRQVVCESLPSCNNNIYYG